MKADDTKELRRLRDENGRLKRMVADQALDIEMLKESPGETSEPGPPTRRGSPPGGAIRGLGAHPNLGSQREQAWPLPEVRVMIGHRGSILWTQSTQN
jgi:hypothetical protein